MRDLMELLCEYAQNRRMTGYLDRQIYWEAQRLEEKKTETQARPLALPDPSRKPHEAAR